MDGLLSLVDCPEQLSEGGISCLRTPPVDAELSQPLGVRGKVDPGRPTPWVDSIGPAANDQVRIKARHFLSKRA